MREICSVEVCDREAQNAGLCGGHYKRSKTGGDMSTPITGPYTPKPDCSVEGCQRPVRTAGLCSMHYVRKWQGKNITDPLRVTAKRGVRTARDEHGRKQCSDCGQWLNVSAFGLQPRSGDGLRSRCKGCARYEGILYKYGISRIDFDQMFLAQGEACAICQSPDPRGRHWCIDHDHTCCPDSKTCGACVRGVLCDPCNVGLGRFGDSAANLRAAAQYLESSLAA